MIKTIKRFLLIFILSISSACSLQGGNDTSPTNAISGVFPETTLNLSADAQAKFKTEWMNNVSGIKRGSYQGRADIWGDGALNMQFWFQDGDLWDSMIDVDNKPFVLHTLMEKNTNVNKAMFVDGKTAIVFMPGSASPKLMNSLYVLIVSNNSIYRTASAKGFANINNWDKVTIPKHDMTEIAKRLASSLSSEMVTGGQSIQYKLNSNAPITLQYDKSRDKVETNKNLLKITINSTVIYLDTDFVYKNNAQNTYNVSDSGGSSYKYTVMVQNDKITQITITTLVDNTKLNPSMFKGVVNIYTVKYRPFPRPPRWNTNKFTNDVGSIQIDKSKPITNNIVWMIPTKLSTEFDLGFPLDTSKAIANEIIYTNVYPTKYEIKIITANNLVTDVYKQYIQ